ncbi:MAG: phosphoribosylformylglycinamidine cyclo-ligase, partial [Deltaproteobacteria bacterium]|nr:phosphoribosylformylglycinamidine cyclo-ligase [Deltaproteobacteria bacterium]
MKEPLSYKAAGVDIEAADAFVNEVAKLARATHSPSVLPHSAAYASLFRLDLAGMSKPVLAGTCDGVGTKLLVAREAGRYRGLGQDLVAMNVNDLLPVAARPLFFLDYIACGKLDPAALTEVVAGMADACKAVGCSLIGGETAEMPGLYSRGDFDLAGFAVGLADEEKLPRPDSVAAGDWLLALPSSGIHSNGLSLAREALFTRGGMHLGATPSGLTRTLADELLEPTALYVKPALELHRRFGFKTAAHVTGGGLFGRLAKLARPGQRLTLDPSSFGRPAIFDLIAKAGAVSPLEMA